MAGDAFCNRGKKATLNRKARYQIRAGRFGAPFSLTLFSFEVKGAPVVGINVSVTGSKSPLSFVVSAAIYACKTDGNKVSPKLTLFMGVSQSTNISTLWPL